MRTGTVWSFRTKRFRVSLIIERERGYQYDGDDQDGETQAELDSGELVAFNSRVEVELDGNVIGTDALFGSVYKDGEESDFWTDHRNPNPDNRNTLAMKERRVCICHYFPDMVREAISEARCYVRDMTIPPYIREGAR